QKRKAPSEHEAGFSNQYSENCAMAFYAPARVMVTAISLIIGFLQPMKKIRILFVCLGNICRSPLAEAIFKHKIREKALESRVEVHSCGTANYHVGELPDPRTIKNALQNGIVMDHLGRQLSEKDLETYDFIVAMDKSNHANILKLENAHAHAHKIKLMRSFDLSPSGDEVPDPYYGNEAGFQQVFDILSHSTDSFIQYLEREHFTS
ncbi:MAG TPA: low molecular weight protein-tyrosine-phosphatase, partial [Cyclobacteriaceae bacterium]|nr:low molecular weight protein-tyrosine-phosphatase [Cyclobacteriaceae bacterium]